ncbi:hypothetical protein [Streptomyces sp. HNM0574]|uniref:hypothetical protein n=1 Tax=Streptomyces sp. HNM0574 TaxID=2714954 RepID=UPI001469E2D0|nr:hypothetical protein [Streptomyces sp. HNM0574]NLU66611.1 hypothetical protein [Streptomyces sp. HNM0574]
MGTGLFSLNGFVAEGLRDQGELRKGIANLLVVLQARPFTLTDAARERITTCRDNDALDRWFRRALTATTLDEVFGEEQGDSGEPKPEGPST